MKRLVLDLAMLVTCAVAAIANVWIAHTFGFDVFGFTFWLIIPVGAFFVGMLAASGAYVAARMFHIRPTAGQGLISAVIIGSATMLLIYYLDYQTGYAQGSVRIRAVMDFWSYLDLVLTRAPIQTIGHSIHNLAAPGPLGYLLALIKLAGFVIGSFVIFVFIGRLAVCWRCRAYMADLRSRESTDLPIDEAIAVHRNFLTGDVPAMQKALAWPPSLRQMPSNGPKARLVFTWYACPRCEARMIGANVRVADRGSSFRDAKGARLARRITEAAELAAVFPDKVPT